MSKASLFFYDLETTGFSPREARIMQFAGQRTSLDLEPIGEPHNHLIKLTEDILPDPGAVLITGITPQQTIADGITEAEFLKLFHSEIAVPGTIFVGYNNIRFDDEFIRFLNYRNFYDAYEWHWSMERSRWDMLDVVRMTRALRPGDIKWSFAADGAPSNGLEDLAAVNQLLHDKAHDALSDVLATIALAKLIQTKQPKLFGHLLAYRDKKKIAELVNTGKPFTYTSGKYASAYLHTTAAALLGEHPKHQGVLVFDLRHDPQEILALSEVEILERWQHRCYERPCPHPRLPIKTMQFNRCPAVAPLSVIDAASAKRISLDLKIVAEHHKALGSLSRELHKKILAVLEQLDKKQAEIFANEQFAESALYDNFISDDDKKTSRQLLETPPEKLKVFLNKFEDVRLKSMLPLYITKNYPKVMDDEMRAFWEELKRRKLLAGGENSKAATYFKQLAELASAAKLSASHKYLLEELQLWGQSIMPEQL